MNMKDYRKALEKRIEAVKAEHEAEKKAKMDAIAVMDWGTADEHGERADILWAQHWALIGALKLTHD